MEENIVLLAMKDGSRALNIIRKNGKLRRGELVPFPHHHHPKLDDGLGRERTANKLDLVTVSALNNFSLLTGNACFGT